MPYEIARPTSDGDREGWRAYWAARGMPWRTEPEIDEERQAYLAERRAVTPNIEESIFPFRAGDVRIKLTRADIEWMLMTHDQGTGPVDWFDPSQRRRTGLDIRGADVSGVNLRHLPLARLQAGIGGDEWRNATSTQRFKAATLLKEAVLTYAHLEGSVLTHTHLNGAALNEAHLESADLFEAHLEAATPANLHATFFDAATKLDGVTLANSKGVGPRLFEVHWGEANLTSINWSPVRMVSDEYRARSRRTSADLPKTREQRSLEYTEAVRTYRQLYWVLHNQGLSEEAARFDYRAKRIQRVVLRRQGLKKLPSYLGSLGSVDI